MTENHKAQDLYQRIQREMTKVIIGKNETEKLLMVCLLAGGHILIEGLPGTAKTKIAKTFSTVIGGDFKRIQFTPDMMPGDITGFYVYSPDGESRFIEGPIFANIILADELNRTTPRTQSALLEAMQEYQVTIEGKKFTLTKPFMVIATQVPAGGEGTYPLTDVQIDRFLLRVKSQYPGKEDEKKIIAGIDQIDEPDISAVTDINEIRELQQMARSVFVSPDVVEYIVSIVSALRQDPDVYWGPSVRAGVSLYKCARVMALLDGRDFVIPDDVKTLIHDTVEHRLRVKSEAEIDDVTPAGIIDKIVESIPVPKLNL